MFDFLSYAYGGIRKAGTDHRADGEKLATRCLADLHEKSGDAFQPKLLVLLASPAYLENENDAQQLLDGINAVFNENYDSVPLIGSSVAAVFFGGKIYDKGALLVCLASDLIKIKVGCGEHARTHGDQAIEGLLRQLKVGSDNIDPNPLANKIILTFLPGCRRDSEDHFYPAPDLQKALYKGVDARIMMAGGVSSSNNRNRDDDGVQFFGEKVLKDSVVAALVTTGVPIGSGPSGSVVGRTGSLITDVNMRREASKYAEIIGTHFMKAKVKILAIESYPVNGEISTWYRVKVISYGCSADSSLGCGKKSSGDSDEGWMNAKHISIE